MIDLEGARQRTGITDDTVMRSIIEALMEEAPMRLGEIRRGLDDCDATKILIAAHTLKGATRVFGVSEVSELAEQIELAAGAAQFDAIPPLFVRLERQTHEMQQELLTIAESMHG